MVSTTELRGIYVVRANRLGTKKHVAVLEKAPRLAARLILRAYKSMALLVLQSEARLQSVTEKLPVRVSNHLTKLCALAPDHPLHRCISAFSSQGSSFLSPVRTNIVL